MIIRLFYFILLRLLSISYEHIVTIMLYGNDTIELNNVIITMLCTEIKNKLNYEDKYLIVICRVIDQRSNKDRLW